MHKNLVIVESPAKAKTIEKFLGKDYTVMSSFGHIRDLKEKDFGIDLENNYKPTYVVPDDKKKVVGDLKKAAKEADIVWLASDEDREGEAIAWHLFDELKLNKENTRRIVFHEITKPAILHAIENPRDIDLNLVDAQQARRVLDRIVGFELSPVLWRKIKPSLSAGRVQSVTVRLVVEREREIQNFVAEASYKVTALFSGTDLHGEPCEFQAELKHRFATREEAHQFLQSCTNATFTIEKIEKNPGKKSPAAPFTTSTLQQEASRKLGYSVSQTMRIAQKLYESGKITYMRTDSLNLSDLALGTISHEIKNIAGDNYLRIRKYHTKTKGAQEAHEAIRPTYISEHNITGSSQEQKLYELIWKRTIASQMADAEVERTTITIGINGNTELFVATGEVLTFDGFLRVYMESVDDEQEQDHSGLLPVLSEQQTVNLKEAVAQERFSQKPPRYTEASLVRKLEELGIGRPSTYAPTISTILNREYVDKREIVNNPRTYHLLTLRNGTIKEEVKKEKGSVEKGKLSPTDIGIVVNDFLTVHFPSILDYNFTAKVEESFDEIAEGTTKWTENIDDFYKKFHPHVKKAIATTGKKAGERYLGIDPKSGKPVYAKISRFGSVIQIGEATDEEKPKFSALQKGQSLESITLEEALELFKLPMNVGKYEDTDMIIAVGRFGPYIKHGKTFYSLPKGKDPLETTYEEAIEIIEAKRQEDKNKQIKHFPEDDILVLNGRFGAYIAHNGSNYKIPKTMKTNELTLEDCKAIIADESNAPKAKTKRKKANKK
ncbi:MAG TPA: type I DNA topoisomerase [Paludibacteraceae bacterium]|nr:type I DNA topoisomerase [Paludibacteraceae bacterium]HQB68915.1 type I DNA topoisomerase [Paludibacteraceae bacterium]HRS67224.1 type I DNA topoisomerase [Paludibacteraceae bacterium]